MVGRFNLLLFICSLIIENHAQVEVDEATLEVVVEDPRCKTWAGYGECDRNPKFMMHVCAMACSRQKQQKLELQHPSKLVWNNIGTEVGDRLDKLLTGSFSSECQKEVTDALSDHLKRLVEEKPSPFQDYHFRSQCPKKKESSKSRGTVPKDRVPPPRPEDIKICYVLLIHEKPKQAIRLIEALQEPGHSFIVHLDGKASVDVFQGLFEFTQTTTNVFMVPEAQRVNISWGGFNMVRATLNGMEEALRLGLEFGWVVNLSGATYPLVSNKSIRQKLSKLRSDSTSMMEVNPEPSEPSEGTWHYFVECDNKLRRISSLGHPRGISMYTGSQWFFAAKPFVEWILTDQELVTRYSEYAAHIVVADENFFATLLKNSPFCHDHENTNMLQVQFDQWEHDKNTHKEGIVNSAKCLQPNPNHCGRSPTINTVESLPVLELSKKIWARKFDPDVDDTILNAIDILRTEGQQVGAHFRRTRARITSGGVSLCLVITSKHGDPVRLEGCQDVASDQLLDVGPCSSDGSLSLSPIAPFMNLTKGRFSRPFCPIMSVETRNCLDLEGESVDPGTNLIGWSCSKKWNQLFSFGDDEFAGSIFLNVPLVLYQDKRLCLEAVDFSEGSHVTVRDCNPSSKLQLFEFDVV